MPPFCNAQLLETRSSAASEPEIAVLPGQSRFATSSVSFFPACLDHQRLDLGNLDSQRADHPGGRGVRGRPAIARTASLNELHAPVLERQTLRRTQAPCTRRGSGRQLRQTSATASGSVTLSCSKAPRCWRRRWPAWLTSVALSFSAGPFVHTSSRSYPRIAEAAAEQVRGGRKGLAQRSGHTDRFARPDRGTGRLFCGHPQLNSS